MALDLSTVDVFNEFDIRLAISRYRREATTHGGEWATPCPWCGGRDRFRVWPYRNGTPHFWCRGCDEHGDIVTFVQKYDGIGFIEACKALGIDVSGKYTSDKPKEVKIHLEIDEPPFEAWQQAGMQLIELAEKALWGADTRALDILRARGMDDETIRARRYGYIPNTNWDVNPKAWGMQPTDKKFVIFRGILIPWISHNTLWKLSIRLFDEDIQANILAGYSDKRYQAVRGGGNGIYRADTVRKHQPLFIFEGEINADLLAQELAKAGLDNIAVIATGSAAKGRADNWLMLVASASPIFLSFDPDHGGDKAIKEHWGKHLARAITYRTPGGDLNDMLLKGKDVVKWAQRGLQLAGTDIIAVAPAPAPVSDPQSDPALAERIKAFTSRPCGSCGGYDYAFFQDGRLICPCYFAKLEESKRPHSPRAPERDSFSLKDHWQRSSRLDGAKTL